MEREQANRIIAEAAGREVEPSEEIESLGLDSLETLDLFVALDIPDRSAQQMKTVGDILSFLELRSVC